MADYIDDRGFASAPIYITDLDGCQPATAISPEPRHRHWRAMPYETVGLSGTMLLAGPETAAPSVVYPLDQSG